MRLLLLLGCTVLVAACSAVEHPEDISLKLKRGAEGEGRLYQPDQEGDPFIKTKPRVGT
ncbi:MAG: hypothetical protein M3O82_05670 [Verrucomicrobiota bacterium]|nr:hypothetical protein [Verrucomicrobiota bacterium]